MLFHWTNTNKYSLSNTPEIVLALIIQAKWLRLIRGEIVNVCLYLMWCGMLLYYSYKLWWMLPQSTGFSSRWPRQFVSGVNCVFIRLAAVVVAKNALQIVSRTLRACKTSAVLSPRGWAFSPHTRTTRTTQHKPGPGRSRNTGAVPWLSGNPVLSFTHLLVNP